MTISTFFATPFYRATDNDELLAANVTRCCLDMKSAEFEKPDPPQGKIPGVFESNFNFLDNAQSHIQDLRTLIQKHLISFIAVVNDSDPNEIANFPMNYHSWFHITSKGGYFRAHTHPLASWSVVYCASRGDDSHKQDHNMGDIVFYDPRGNASMFLDPTNRAMRRELSFNSFKISPRHGDLLIFPSYITHFVEPYQGDLPRVTIAANYWVNV
ncbi:MAG: TIGR02466 family protein [Proteobacteria bacterium]|nr:TIGR02466 family protein [Pseudomonadota bacterium]